MHAYRKKIEPASGVRYCVLRVSVVLHFALVILLSIMPIVRVACEVIRPETQKMFFTVENGDTLYHVYFRDILVYPPLVFKNKRQERFYWKTVRDVKKTLPYAKKIKEYMIFADSVMAELETDKDRRRWWRQFERQLFKTYEKDFKSMYASQGRMLMKLLDRETNQTSYQIIAKYKGKISANFWQFIAKLFRNDLKEEYDGNDKDKIIERVINLVEAGQL